jgi:ABC-type multidrug transport system fused ATPase/permease subunit
MSRLVIDLLRPYRGWLAIVFVAMLVEIAAGLAAPWPLKLVIDDALGNHHLPHWLAWAHEYAGFGKHTLGVALFAGAATLAIAVVGAIASYIDNYYTTSAGQWVANDLRLRIYEHLHRLSLRYYRRAVVGSINLSPGSFDDRRELAVETSCERVVGRLIETAEHDWKHSRKLPLSDAAVLAELEGHGVKDIGRLALARNEEAHARQA